jgi:hypothetical protein
MTYNKTKYTGIKASENTIQLDFIVNGVRFRETLKVKPTQAALKHANTIRENIRLEDALGKLDLLKYFPNSKKARKVSINQSKYMTVEKLLNDFLKRKQKSCAKVSDHSGVRSPHLSQI